MPRYVERFRCIGPSCEDTCCVGWPVHIDKKTYKAYRNQSHPALQPVVAQMKRMDKAGSDSMYAMIPLAGPQGRCSAQQDGMCAVQATLGESYLSDTCQSYPRVTRQINDQPEQSMTLSCPEAARLALLAEDAFEFVEAPASVREGTVIATRAAGRISPELMNEVRIFCLNLVRTRELKIWQRLALLGAFCEALERYRTSGQQIDGVQRILDDFMHAIERGDLLQTLDLIQPNHEAQAMVFATLWSRRGFSAASVFQQAQMQAISAGLGGNANGQVSAAGLVAAYRRGLERLDLLLEQAPWVLEHYLLNEMFTQVFPVHGDNAYDAYLQLIARYGLLRLLLAARCNTEGELPPLQELVSTVALQCRRFQHDQRYTQEVNTALRQSGWADLDKLYTLIRS